jgi:amino acid adenylation domain-containing protein
MKRRMQLSHQVRPSNQWPLFDFQLTHFINNNEHQFRLHIGFDLLIADLWSLDLIFSELSQLYHNQNMILPTIEYSHRDYILALNQIKNTIVYEKDKKYWIDRLHSFPFGTRLPLRCSLKELKEQRFIRLQQILDRSIWNQLKQRISNTQLTPAGFLAAIYATVLAKWSNDQHFAINLPVFNRLPIHPQVNQIAGDFTSIIPLEIHLEQKLLFSQFVQIIQKQLWNDLVHMSFDGISFIRQLMHINQMREIAFPIVFMCGLFNSDLSDDTNKMHMLFEKAPVYGISQTPQVYLDNQIYQENGQLIVRWDHVENLFPPAFIDAMQSAFIDLLRQLALSDEIWNEPVYIQLPVDQLHRRSIFLKTKWQSHVEPHLLHALVIEQAQRVPNAWAILTSRENLTYQQLMNRVYSLAYHLQQQGTQSKQLIGILMKKGWEQVVACLAILITGAAYLPLDIDSPYDRLSQILEETNVKIILIQSHCQHSFTHLITIPVDTFTYDEYSQLFPIKQQSSTDLAYVIYTSGSTGKPKGVMISHQAVLNTILDINSRLEISTDDRILALSHLNFDLSVYDIFGMLIAGGTIVIPDHDHYKNPQHWYDMIIKHHVTIWNSVPMLMQMLVEHLQETYIPNQLQHVLLSGDWIPLSLPQSIQTTFGEQVTITSLGGATEASIWSIAFTLPKQISHEWKSIPYGMPLRNQHYYVYDAHLDDCPEWVNGELYIGGVGLADGYWNDPEKTGFSFIIHPCTGERLYRTGDQGRFIPDGYIEFMGRKDFQVKVHGHRIELGEIEYHLQQHSDIHQAIVTVDRTSQQLIGYIIPEINFEDIQHQHEVKETFSLIQRKLTEKEWNETLKAYLSEKLPAYMIPSHFMTVASFSLSANGKIDRNSLPQVSMSILEEEKTYIAPNTELEKTIANIWQQLLCTDRFALQQGNSKSNRFSSSIDDTISLTDNTASNFSCQDSRIFSPLSTTTSFFDLGGDSLLLIQIYQRYYSLFDFDTEALTIRPFFTHHTLAEHAKLLETFVINNRELNQWHTIHINEGKN